MTTNRLGKHQLVAEIARGGMGIVYLAVSQGPARFSKLLVVKELKPELVDDPSFLEMFMEEARLAARLNHPNIVQTYEVGAEGTRHYIVMDYLDGVPLARVLRKKSAAFTLPMHLRVLCEALRGLHYAHTLRDFDGSTFGIVHRDVNPQNVFVTYDGQSKLVDFGIAKALDSSIETRTGVLKGKPAYMAPEQIAGEVDARADVFAAGVMVWEAIAGHRMWQKKGDVEVLTAILKGDLPRLREAAPQAPDDLVRICERAIAQDRTHRYTTADDLRSDLEAWLDATGQNVQMPEVGEAVGTIFAEERARTRTQIETYVTRIKAAREDERLPSIRPPTQEVPITPLVLPSVPYSSTLVMDAAPSTPPPRRIHLFVGLGLVVVALLVGGFFVGARIRITKPAELPIAEGTGRVEPPAVPTALPTAEPTSDPSSAAKTPSPPSTVEEKRATRLGPVVRPPPGRPAPQPTAPPPPSPSPTPEARPLEGTGFLTMDTYPWTRVSENGRVLGDTPLVRLPLSAGTHTLVFENSTEKVRQSLVVVIKPGETVSKRLAF